MKIDACQYEYQSGKLIRLRIPGVLGYNSNLLIVLILIYKFIGPTVY